MRENSLPESLCEPSQFLWWSPHFLRHYGFEVRLEKNDGSAAFASDATFRRVAGLKDSTATSFQSFNFPDRYVRHSAFALRVDPVTTDTDRQDATFRVG